MYHYDIFLSYAYNDREYARLLRIRLSEETPRFYVWFDETNIFLGNNLENSIETGLENSHYGVILLSRDYLRLRRWTDFEFNRILENDRIFLITHKIELEEIETEYPDVYEVIREIRSISTNSHIDVVLTTVKEVVRDSIVRQRQEFTPLRNLLADRDWYRADAKTSELVNKKGGIFKISPEDLNLLDYLWLKYSRNHYGFSIQWEIYQECYRSSRDDLESYNKFYTNVNWPIVSNSYHTDTPKGHLPTLAYFKHNLSGKEPLTINRDGEVTNRHIDFFNGTIFFWYLGLVIIGLSFSVFTQKIDALLTGFILWTIVCLLVGSLGGCLYGDLRTRQRARNLHKFFTSNTFNL